MLHVIHPVCSPLHPDYLLSLDKDPFPDSRLKDVPTSQAPIYSLTPTKHSLFPLLIPLVESHDLDVNVGTDKSL